MNRARMARVAAWCLSTVIVLCFVSPAVAQRDREAARNSQLPTPAGEITHPSLPLPLPIAQGARWLRYSLLAPLQQQQPIQPPAPAQAADSREIRELQGVQKRLGSVLDGTFLAGDRAKDQSEQRRIWERMEQERLASEAAQTRRVSDDGETETLPGIMQWAAPADPLQLAAEQLRASARNLDQAAADLEDAGKYKEADKLRSRAQQLRNDARGFSQPVETTEVR